MELYLKVRLACSEGMSRRRAAKHFNISRDSVAKMMSYSTPPSYPRQSPIRRPKLAAFVSTIDHWPGEDMKVPRKQRHTAKRVFDRRRDECGSPALYDPSRIICASGISVARRCRAAVASARPWTGRFRIAAVAMRQFQHEEVRFLLHAANDNQRLAGIGGLGRWPHPCVRLFRDRAAVDRLRALSEIEPPSGVTVLALRRRSSIAWRTGLP